MLNRMVSITLSASLRRLSPSLQDLGAMKRGLAAALSGLLLVSGAAHARDGGGDLTQLRGFKIGRACLLQEPAYDALRREGFDVPPVGFTCFHQAGDFHTDFLMHDENGKQELLELFYAPDSTLWRVRVSVKWHSPAKLALPPTPRQLEASLLKRFGPPQSGFGAAVLLRDAHRAEFAWPAVPWNGGAAPPGWFAWADALTGVATKAQLRWVEASPAQSLVVEMTNREILPAAARAQADELQARAARQAARDQSMLGGL